MFELLKSKNGTTSLVAVRKRGLQCERSSTDARTVGSGHPKSSSKQDDHVFKLSALRDRERSLGDLTNVSEDRVKGSSQNDFKQR